MTDNGPIDVTTFALALLEGAHRTLTQAMDGLTEERLCQQPSPDTNSIGWLAWHLSRWKDRFAADAAGEPQVWVSEGWAGRFGMDEERHGQGDSLEQVAAFRPAHELLQGYVEAAHAATVERVARLTPERLLEEAPYVPGGTARPIWRSLAGTVSDFSQHTGQIAYLRGLITGYGWRAG